MSSLFIDLVKGADVLIYPLCACSLILFYIIAERAYALRKAAVMPDDLVDAIVSGKPITGGRHSTLARIIDFAEKHPNDPDALRAFARFELIRMERGVPYLDMIYSGSPLIGLVGTVWGMIRLFKSTAVDGGLPDPVKFNASVSLALGATLFGIVIAVPALVGGGYFQRKIDHYAAQIDVLLERIIRRTAAAGRP